MQYRVVCPDCPCPSKMYVDFDNPPDSLNCPDCNVMVLPYLTVQNK